MTNNASLIKVHVHEHTGTIILNRPEKRNALTRSMLAELTQALDDLHASAACAPWSSRVQARPSAPAWI